MDCRDVFRWFRQKPKMIPEPPAEDVTIEMYREQARVLWNLIQIRWSGMFGDDYDWARHWLTAELCKQGGCTDSAEIFLLRETYSIDLPRHIWDLLYALYTKGHHRYGIFCNTRGATDWEAHLALEQYNDAQRPIYKEVHTLLKTKLK